MDPKRMTFLASFRLEPSTFARARRLLSISETEEGLSSTIAGCVVVLCSAGLSKMIADLLSYRAEDEAMERNVPADSTKYGLLLKKGLITQIQECPYMISSGRFYIESKNEVFRTLRRMIELRNLLMHIPDGTVRLPGDDPWINIENGVAEVKIPLKPDPWDQVGLAAAAKMHEATMNYWNDIEPNGNMQEGLLLKKSNAKGTP